MIIIYNDGNKNDNNFDYVYNNYYNEEEDNNIEDNNFDN